MLISVQLNFIISSYNFNDLLGQIFNLFILMVAAAEVAIGLALLIINYRLRGTIETKFIYLAKG
jgi:NADH:ubiquinone oxidoreductase subunit K